MRIAGGDLSMNGSGICVLDVDEDWNIVGVDWLGFTQIKKRELVDPEHVVWYRPEDYNHRFALTQMMIDRILEKIEGCSYIAIENFAFGAMGKLADIGEFVGQVSMDIWRKGIELKWYSPSMNKKFFSGFGQSDKIGMYEAYLRCPLPKPNLKTYPEPTDGKGITPTSDIIDAYALALLLRAELSNDPKFPHPKPKKKKKQKNVDS